MRYLFLITLVHLLFVFLNSLHLTTNQLQLINNLIKNKNLDLNQRVKINQLLYASYEKWAVKKAQYFKKHHLFKCKNIHISELVLSSKIGLFKATKKYNGNIYFTYFADLYVRSELYKTLTAYFATSSIPKNIRIKNKKNLSETELTIYNQNIDSNLINYSNSFQMCNMSNMSNMSNNIEETIIEKQEKYQKYLYVWKKINKLDGSFRKRIFMLKYDFDFKELRSNKEIAVLMCCSEETVRQKLNIIL
jgi:hypothetical protein